MKVVLGKKQGYEIEKEVNTAADIHDYLLNERHGEYVYVRYFDDNGNCIKEYTVRCWYNSEDTISAENGRALDWELSQKSNTQKILKYLQEDNIDLTDYNINS